MHIKKSAKVEVLIYLQGDNELITTNRSSAGLQKDNLAKLTINNAPDFSGSLNASNNSQGTGAGIGGGYNASGTNIYILGGSVTATSYLGAGIGGGYNAANANDTCDGGNGSNIHISNSSVIANSTSGAGIGGGCNASGANGTCNGGNGSDIHISNSSVTATSYWGGWYWRRSQCLWYKWHL